MLSKEEGLRGFAALGLPNMSIVSGTSSMISESQSAALFIPVTHPIYTGPIDVLKRREGRQHTL